MLITQGWGWDHPRVCGEHSHSLTCLRACPGSSPRMRGAPLVADAVRGRDGIIPAYAGSTAPSRKVEVHGLGSSPRMRGAPSLRALASAARGIIPAYAGSTSLLSSFS